MLALALSLRILLALSYLATGLIGLFAITHVRDRRERRIRGAREALHGIEAVRTTLGYVGSPTTPPYRGVGRPLERHEPLRAPLSGRPCLAYRIAIGVPRRDGFISLEYDLQESKSIPFRLDDPRLLAEGLHVALTSDFRLSPGGTPARVWTTSELRPQIPPARRQGLLRRLDRGALQPRREHYYEWIVPLDETIELITTRPKPLTASYCATGELELQSAYIHVGSRDDAASVERLRRIEAAAVRDLRAWRRRAWLNPAIVATIVAYVFLSFWAFRAPPPRRGEPRRGPTQEVPAPSPRAR
jgi:hypothetical protein